MIYYYSPSTGCFYTPDIHGQNIPADAIEITAERHAELMAGQANGQQIVPGENGAPELSTPNPVVVAPTRVETYAAINWLIAHKDSEGVSLWSKIKASAAAMPEGDDKEVMLNGINRAKYWLRADPLVEIMRQIIGMSTEELDAAFVEINTPA